MAEPKLYWVIHVDKRTLVLVHEEEAIRISGLDKRDFDWCIEEFGRCDTDVLTIVPLLPNNKG